MKRRAALVALLAPSALLALIVALLATAPIEQARGAFPGHNGKIAYVRPLPAQFKGILHTVRPDGSHRKRIGKGTYPLFFPGGRRLLVSRPGGAFVMHASGSHVRKIPHVPPPPQPPSLLPNGKRIAFARRNDDNSVDFFTIRLDGSHLHTVPRARFPAAFSPAGNKIVVYERCHFLIMRRNGTHKRRLTHPGPYDCDFNPDFSPNGKKVVFERSGTRGHDIYLVRKTGRHERALTSSGAAGKYDNRDPAFSPNGKKVVYERDKAALHSVIATRRLDGSHRRILPLPVGVAWPNWGVRP